MPRINIIHGDMGLRHCKGQKKRIASDERVLLSFTSGGPPGPHQYPPQGWGNTYQQWQPQAPHDPSE